MFYFDPLYGTCEHGDIEALLMDKSLSENQKLIGIGTFAGFKLRVMPLYEPVQLGECLLSVKYRFNEEIFEFDKIN